jgi:chemotaxis protein CheD
MNHMLLAVSTANKVACNLAGINAMELLINDLLKLGAQRPRLRAKAFGGARMVSGLSDIGQSNIDFTLDFLTKESIICEGHSLGGSSARHIKFWPASGRVMQKIAKDTSVQPLDLRPVSEVSGNGLELF